EPVDKHDEPIGRAVIAEIVAFEITRKIVEAKYKTRDDIDAAQTKENRRKIGVRPHFQTIGLLLGLLFGLTSVSRLGRIYKPW
ncbi:MAG: hypothetical protein ACR2Q3_12390, partial [Woeseiaceae bacterium]